MKVSDHLVQKILARKKLNGDLFFDKAKMEVFVTGLYHLLFLPQQINTEEQMQKDFDGLKKALFELILNISDHDKNLAQKEADNFFLALPDIFNSLVLDAESILEFDPATESLAEILLSYPGFFATYVYRISHQLWIQQVKVLPRVISEYAHSRTGVDIHPGAEIGSHFFIDHGTGIVIGETAVIGHHVKVYQGVTLGALSVAKELANQKRHPSIEDHVIIYSGATILGGNTTIGKDSIIGGNVWITQNVPANSLVYNKSEIKIKDNGPLPESLTFVI
ncbi:serine acetyltransferase [Chryseobacterium sp. G0240]|uniref:serine O-acetyltransferase EpsC n=1 Tax=Chryseobacterium sp. G0240 TaxID=2487066 RepID=UPI000F450A11|nr:serine O-acetyltransferase EpsC [Chryseobacterium sp. G0240]ROI01376.1 serine acetyltransferase [Chryseobacterium sp. G0240]